MRILEGMQGIRDEGIDPWVTQGSIHKHAQGVHLGTLNGYHNVLLTLFKAHKVYINCIYDHLHWEGKLQNLTQVSPCSHAVCVTVQTCMKRTTGVQVRLTTVKESGSGHSQPEQVQVPLSPSPTFTHRPCGRKASEFHLSHWVGPCKPLLISAEDKTKDSHTETSMSV